ncbi:MAG: bifunctional oligoribonuclease/PAP phosphatase NrnA [Edaphobacter sp.]|uniref:DHH family phosphoesterase n=1 Tax=Edaphobacter sp. TaxID=1934404 RepID=UPI0023998CC7|nr:bifunctional oligoribonuclease/PAP phosphatase NrnA [Edaphobacter sp.]MDE1177321.1 bifunctional oligoribonuclease/PAP phosphatase NrnA [Edaphobacter sp.]
MSAETSIRALLEAFRSHPRFIVTSHARPDGDAIGSVLAISEILGKLGVEVRMILCDEIPAIYRSLPNVDAILQAPDVREIEPDLSVPVIVMECDGIPRTGLQGLDGRMLINIDHHASGREFASVNWIDENACAVAEMVYRLARGAQVEITPSMATCLYTAILSDTGSFTYPSTSADTFAIAHDLAAHGADPSLIARDIYFSNPESKIRLLGTALSNMHTDGPLAWSWVTTEDMVRAGAGAEDCEGVVNYLISIAGVESAVFLRQLPEVDTYRLSIRSKGKIDVAQVAEHFGGGGHRAASGCTLDGPLSVATEKVLHELKMGLC